MTALVVGWVIFVVVVVGFPTCSKFRKDNSVCVQIAPVFLLVKNWQLWNYPDKWLQGEEGGTFNAHTEHCIKRFIINVVTFQNLEKGVVFCHWHEFTCSYKQLLSLSRWKSEPSLQNLYENKLVLSKLLLILTWLHD